MEREGVERHRATVKRRASGSSSPPRQPTPPPSPATYIHQLPDDVLEVIFRLLSMQTIVNVLSVCQRWRGVIENHNLIKELDFEKGAFNTEEAQCLIRSAGNLKSLKLWERDDAVDLLTAASAYCTNVHHLSVKFWKRSISFIEALGRVFQTSPHITDLCMIYISLSNDLKFYQELGVLLPHLRKVEFEIFPLSNLQLDALIDSFSRHPLEEFKATYNPCSDAHIAKLVQFWGRSLRVLEVQAASLTDGALVELAGCSELRRLKLVFLSIRGDGLRGLAALSHLEDLHLSHCTEIKQENWCNFFSQSSSSHGLRKLCLEGCRGVDSRVLASVADFCPQLQELNVPSTKVSLPGVRKVLRCCTKLQEMNVYSTDASVAQVLPELPQLAHQLRRFCIGERAMHSLDKATLRRVQAQMPRLRILEE